MDLESMVVAELVGKLVLASVFGYLYATQGERSLGIWALAWGAAALFNVAFLALPPPAPEGIALRGTLQVMSAAGFLWGARAFAGRPVKRIWGLALVPVALWIALAPSASLPFEIHHAPFALVLGSALLYVAWTLIRHSGPVRFESSLAGGALGLWGLHVLDYPILVPVEGFAPYGFLISFALQLTAAIGMLLLYLRRTHDLARESAGQLAQVQKMDALGRLAGGVAHDFNNLLTVMLGSLSSVRRTDENRESLALAESAVVRASDLTRQLLSFSREQVTQIAPVDLVEIVHASARMLDRILGEGVHMDVRVPETAWIEADPGSLEQILMNLAINARDAMPDGGCLRIRVTRVDREAPLSWSGGELAPGSYFELSVSDEGTGISEEQIPYIFDPFFTTKPSGQGTGIGLSTVQALAQRLGGSVSLDTEPGKGSTFRVCFRRSIGPVEAERVPAADDRGPAAHTILVAEDDEGVRVLMASALERDGYRVLQAGDGERALEILAHRGAGRPVDLLLTDVVMPRCSGAVLAEQFLRQYPRAAVILTSGYTAGQIERIPPGCRFLAKPFTPSELASHVRAALGAGRPHRSAARAGRSRPEASP